MENLNNSEVINTGKVQITNILVDDKTGEVELEFDFDQDFVKYLGLVLKKDYEKITDAEIKAYVYFQFTEYMKQKAQQEHEEKYGEPGTNDQSI